MDAFGRTYDQVMQFSQQTELKRFERDRLLAAARLEGIERQKWQVERDMENVRAVDRRAAELFIEVMDRSRRRTRTAIGPRGRRRRESRRRPIDAARTGGEPEQRHPRFRGEAPLAWTLFRLGRCQRVSQSTVICWEDQAEAVAPIAEEMNVEYCRTIGADFRPSS